MTAAVPDNARTITRNSFWYAFEASATTLVMLIASVPVARVMGPEVLGHYIYLVFLTTIAQRLANVGLPATACKYMAEYIGAGQPGIARDVFHETLKYQAYVAAVVTIVGVILTLVFTESTFRFVALLMVVSMWPAMVNNIPAQANVAAEDLRANIPASFVNFTSYAVLVIATLVFGWGLIGLAFATFTSRVLEAIVRYAGVRKRLDAVPRMAAPPELRRRMFTFSRQNLMLLALGLVVWDRSELLFLRKYCDVTQVAFYSLAFSIANQLLMAPRAFSTAIGYTIFAQYGRDRTQLNRLVQNGTRFLWLLSVPLFLGVAVVADPLIRTVYGPKYTAVIPVLYLLSIFAIPRAFQVHTESLLQATETQGFMVKWLAISAVVNIAADWLLIPHYGAIGAAIANGLAQTFAVAGVWFKGRSIVKAAIPMRFMRDVGIAGVLMTIVVLPIAKLPFAPGALAAGIATGALVFAVAIRRLACLTPDDGVRLVAILHRLPPALHLVSDKIVRFLITDLDAGSAEAGV